MKKINKSREESTDQHNMKEISLSLSAVFFYKFYLLSTYFTSSEALGKIRALLHILKGNKYSIFCTIWVISGLHKSYQQTSKVQAPERAYVALWHD